MQKDKIRKYLKFIVLAGGWIVLGAQFLLDNLDSLGF